MKTVIAPVVEDGEVAGYRMDDELMTVVIESLKMNNSFMPSIERVVFNTNTDGPDGPVLTTIVYFADGTKCVVRNSLRDKVTLTEKTIRLSDGSERKVKTASDESREAGVVYAMAKRIVCGLTDYGESDGKGFGKFLQRVLDDSSVQDLDNARAAAERKLSQKRAEEIRERRENEGPRHRNSLRDVVNDLAATVGGLKEVVEELRGGKAKKTSKRR